MSDKSNNQTVQERKAAMPEVEKLVKKHGRITVAWCVKKIQQRERNKKRIQALKEEQRELEKEI